ncbi:MAG: hypothetical protein ABFS39_18900 [Pseudomonadota bacterium]
MKMKAFTLSLAFMAIGSASLAYGAAQSIVLDGIWRMTIAKVDRNGVSNPQETAYLRITDQEGDMFAGYGCPKESDSTDLYGILDGGNVHIIVWDSVAFGTVNQAGTEMNLISQKQLYNESSVPPPPQNEPATEQVVATKLDPLDRLTPHTCDL